MKKLYICLLTTLLTVTASAQPSSCATNTYPANNATNVAAPKSLFSWTAVSGATDYDLYLGTTTTPGLLGNIAGNQAYITSLAYNTTYYWYVVPKNAGGSATGCNTTMTSFTTQISPGIPANNDCAGAATLSGYGTVNGFTQNATQSQVADPGCPGTGNANDDVWYKFTTLQAGNATITVTPTNNNGLDPVVVVYSGACGALTTITCVDAGSPGGAETVNLTGLTTGTTYYVRVYDYLGAGNEGTFTIKGSGPALPVTFTDFSGYTDGRQNMLKWNTATEANNRGFELERSADGERFSVIGTIASKAESGNSTSALSYSYVDSKPLNGSNYYRLKQIDKDGRFTYSSVVILKSKITEISLSSVYPNPAKGLLNVIVSAPSTGEVMMMITDLSGRVVMRQPYNLLAGDNKHQLNIGNLAPGSYMVKVVCGNGCETAIQRFIKQ